MKILGRILASLLVLVIVVGAAAGGAFVYFTRQSFPQTAGSMKLSGLKGNVEVLRDKFGVPHIYADTPEDLFRAQGFVHAQDRYFQMEFQRRIGQGRIAELFGAGAANQDKFIRTVGWARTAAEEVTQLDAEMKSVLGTYADGVNAYALPNADKLGFEFKVLGLIGRQWKPEPWMPVNSLTWGKAMSYNLGGNMDQELARMILAERGGDVLVNTLLPPYPSDMPVIVRQVQGSLGADEPRFATSAPALPSSSAVELYLLNKTVQRTIGLEHDPAVGSNNWVVAGSRTATGKPLLANDPHLGIQMPSIWYMNGLHCRVVNDACPYDVVGVTFPGTPGVVIGHNARIGWGVTNTGPDTQDLFIEKANPDNPNEFEYKGKFEPAQVREEIINVAGKDPITLTVRTTRHGPVMNDALSELKDAQPMALQWSALRPGTLFKSVVLLNKAKNWDEFRAALKFWDTPAQNFVYADVDGNIGYQMPGNIPIRARGDGRAPVPGWTGEYDWTGEIPFDDLPRAYNPPEGYIVTANNAVVDANKYKYFLGLDWDYGYRAKRIEQMILDKANSKLTADDMRAMQADAYSIFSREVMPYFKDATVSNDDLTKEALRRMQIWDGRCDVDSVGCAIFEMFWRELSHAAFDDDAGELAEEIIGRGTFSQITLRTILAEPNATWWNDTGTPAVETRDQQIDIALKKTVANLKERLGGDINTWQWGKLHTVVFPNQTLGKSGIQPIEQIFNRGPYPVAGGMGLVNAVSHNPRTFAVNWGPSWRQVLDASNWSNSLGSHTTGQSGHTFHPHYDDMIALWLTGENTLLLWTREDVERASAEVLTLVP